MADMMDLDDDLDAQKKATTRTSRFVPKNFKPKPQSKATPKPEPDSSEAPETHPPLKPDRDDPIKNGELDCEPPLVDSGPTKMDCEATDGVAKTVEEPPEVEMEEDDGEDELLREVDVCFTPSLDTNTQLYVLQYPLRPCWRPYELDDRCDDVRVKPASAEVELDLSLDVDSKNYDTGFVVEERVTKQTLSSSWKPPRATGYAVGVVVRNKLHLNPVHAVVQLRPSMDHLKSGVSKNKNSEEAVVKTEKIEEEKSAGSSKRQIKPQKVTGEQNMDNGECWVPLKYHGSRSDLSAGYLEKMVAKESTPIQFSMSPGEYAKVLCPGASNEKSKQGPSMRYLLTRPLEERFKTWFREGPPMNRFDTLTHLAPDKSAEDIIEAVKKYAQLVQGLWVPKSSLLYEGLRGPEILARDFVLLLFNKNPRVSYAEVNVSGALGKAIKAVLHTLASERPSFKDWKFKAKQDSSFIKQHEKVVKEQQQAWERMEKPIFDSIFGGRAGPGGIKNPSKPDATGKSPATSKSAGKVSAKSSTGTPMSDETREALPKSLQKLLQTHKVCSFQQICQRLREMAVSESARPKGDAREAIAAANGVDAPQEQLLEIISQVAINIHGVYVARSSTDHPQYDALRKIVINLLIAEGGPTAKLKKASIMEAAKMQLKREVSPIEYQKVLNELCVSQGSAWVLKSGEGNQK